MARLGNSGRWADVCRTPSSLDEDGDGGIAVILGGGSVAEAICCTLPVWSRRARAAAGQVQIGSQGEGLKVLPTREVGLAGRGEQVAEVGVADGVAAELAQERQGGVRASRGCQHQAQVRLDPGLLGASLSADLRERSASAHRPCR